ADIEPNYVGPAIGILVVLILQSGIYVATRWALRRVSIAITYDLRKRFFDHVQFQGPTFFNRFGTGDLMSRAVNDVRMVRMAASYGWVMIAQTLMTFFMGLGYMLWMAPALTGWALIPLPFVGIVGWVMARGMYPYYRERQEAMAAVTSFAQENLNGIRTIQAMAQEDHEIARFNRSSTVYAQKCYRATRYSAFMGVAMGSLSTVSPLIIMFYGGLLVLDGELSVGTWTAFSFYLAMVTMSVTSIGHSLSMFVAAAAGTERLFEVLDAEPEVVDDPHFQPEAPIEGRLEFKSFSYRHPGAPRPTISNIDLHVDAGETVALLGRVGSGKSTILKAAVRLLDTPKGSVFLDDHDVCDFPVRRLREIVTLVPQDPFLFSATLRENLTYDDPDRKDEPIWDAVEAAGLEPTIRDFADGLDTVVGERGITLSGGQKQRATLARGLIRDAKVLLLDDCFSSVDTETEDRILSGLERLRGSKTTLLISHRVSTARHADRIYVVDNGRILETGTHDELLAKDGYYAELEAVQSNQERDRSRKSRLLHDLEADEPALAGVRGDG
ncbi:MAG: ABC transporter ATP-binding protein, partial [Gammaproteobacteria bacterium]|nr:ABC transporter ATP-binding protein [Gammaproteobacteria bacterium]